MPRLCGWLGCDIGRSGRRCLHTRTEQDLFLADERLRQVQADLRRCQANVEISLGLALLEQGQRAEARRRLLGALPSAPELRGFGGLALSLLPKPGLAIAKGRALKRRLVPRGHGA